MLRMKKKLLSIVSILLSVILFSSPAMVYAADLQALTKEEILSMDQSELLSFLQEEGLVLPEDYDVHITEMSEPFVYEYTPLILQGKIDSSVRRFNYEPSNQMLFRLYAVLDRLGLAENQSAVPMDSYTLQDSTPIGSWSNNYLNYNCYAYALGSTAWVQPGDYSGEPFALTMPVSDMADVVLADLEVKEPDKQPGEGHHPQQHHDQHGPVADHLVGPAGRLALSLSGLLFHGDLLLSGETSRPGPGAP